MPRFKSIRNILRYGCYKIETLVASMGHRNPRKIVFGAWFGNKYDDNPKALFEWVLANRPDLQARWLTPNKQVMREMQQLGLPVLSSRSIKGLLFALKAKYIVYCTSPDDMRMVHLFPLMKGATFLNLWHGVPLKKIKYDDKYALEQQRKKLDALSPSMRHWTTKLNNLLLGVEENTYHVATSEAMALLYQGVFNAPASRILNLGQARNDYFFYPHDNHWRQQFPDKRIIVYMPTHRKEGKQAIDLEKLLPLKQIDQLLESSNAVMLVKKHYYHKGDKAFSKQEYRNIYDLTDLDIKSQSLIDAADMLVTDYSSVYIDYLLLDRPIFFYAYDLDDYLSSDRQMYMDYNANNIPGDICTTAPSLIESLSKALQGIDTKKDLRHKMRDYYYCKSNQQAVSEKQINKLMSL